MSRIGLVGCGFISQAYAQKLKRLDFVELVACADLIDDRAQMLAKEMQIPGVLSVDALLADPEIDLVLNLTIPGAHAEISRAAVAAGKSVFSEKPFALSRQAGNELVAAAAERRVRVGCAPDTFLGAGLQTCRGLIDAGAIGQPVAANAFMLQPGPELWHPRPQVFYQHGAGPLFDMGPYYFTALVSLLGPACRVTSSARITHATREIYSQPLAGERMQVDVPTHVASVVDFESGLVATLVTSFDVQASRHRNIEIYGTEATLSVPDPNTFGGPVQIRRRDEHEWTELELTHGNREQSRGIGLSDMVSGLRNGRPHRASGELAAHVLDLMQSSLEASQSGRHVELSTRCERPAPLPPVLPDDTFDG